MNHLYYIVAVALSPQETILNEHGDVHVFDFYTDACIKYVETKPHGEEEVRLIEVNGGYDNNWYILDKKRHVL